MNTQTTSSALSQTFNLYLASHLPTMHGWCTPEKARELADLVTASKPRTALEIGVYAGKSIFAIALAMQPGSVTIGIDPWDSHASEQGFIADDPNRQWWRALDHDFIYSCCASMRATLGLENQVFLCRATSQSAYPGFVTACALLDRPPIDFLHIDGNHSEECSLYDVEHYVPLVQPGGYIVFDDIDWVTTKKAQQRLTELCTMTAHRGSYAVYRKV